MAKLKARLSVFLCILFVLSAVLGYAPTTGIVAHAATNVEMIWAGGMGNSNPSLKVEAGQKFHIGDFLIVYETESIKSMSSISSASYSSSNSSVASCRNGIIKTRKPGTTTLTVSYMGQTSQCTLTVVKKGKLNMGAYKSVDDQAVNILNVYGNKISTKNQYQVYNLLSEYLSDDSYKTNIFGLRFKKVNGKISQTNELVAIHEAKVNELSNIMDEYLLKINPIGAYASKPFKITSINAKKGQKQFDFNIKKKVTKDQIFAIKTYDNSDKHIDAGSVTKFKIYIKDMSTSNVYSGIATATQGSNNITVQMKKLVLKKNQTYQLLGSKGNVYSLSHEWTKGKTFKVK